MALAPDSYDSTFGLLVWRVVTALQRSSRRENYERGHPALAKNLEP
jgi:hypothetical protein